MESHMVAASLLRYSSALIAARRYQEAVQKASASLEILQEVAPAAHPNTRLAHIFLADAFAPMKKLGEALVHLRHALPLTEEIYGKESQEVDVLQRNIQGLQDVISRN
jgi:hypothetical protein